MAHAACHGQPRRPSSRTTAPLRSAPHAAGFSFLCGARSRHRRPSRRPMRREWRRQDEPPRGALSAVAGPRPAPGGARRMRAPGRRGRVRALGRSRGGGGDASARLGFQPRRWRRRRGAAQPHRPRRSVVVARVLGPCARRLADPRHGHAVRRTGGRAAAIPRSLRAGDRPGSRRAGRPVRAGVARAQPAPRGGRAQPGLAGRHRARGG